MKSVEAKLGKEVLKLNLPDATDILSMSTPTVIEDPVDAIQQALDRSIESPGLDEVIKEKLKAAPDAKAVISISDNTRPVPYTGKEGILWPIIERLLKNGVDRKRILVLVGVGTHRALQEVELEQMLDPRIFEAGIPIKNHDCRNQDGLVHVGTTKRGSKIYINREYLEADIKILTGLVESHFMAGASGGRKAVLPALAGEQSTYIFHGAEMLGSPNARDLVLEGNPCHEESLEIAHKAGVDYIVNVTLDFRFRLTGVFAGDLEAAHMRAVEKIREYVTIPIRKAYDVVVTHAGFVGINHYQACKAAVVAGGALKPGGWLILIGNNTDTDPVGSANYRSILFLLKFMGSGKFNRLIRSKDWPFVPDQWEVQMWAKLFDKIPMDHFTYYSPHLTEADFKVLPGEDGNLHLPGPNRYGKSLEHAAEVVEKALEQAIRAIEEGGQKTVDLAFLSDGPYGIPVG
jgi:nickel-dependent lactate racemase